MIALLKKHLALITRLERMGLVDVPFNFTERFSQDVTAHRHFLVTFNELCDRHIVRYVGTPTAPDLWRLLPRNQWP